MKEQRLIVTALVWNKKEELLLQKRADPLFPAADGKWEFPGGGVHFGEGLEDAVRRECQEEVGCTVEIDRMLPMVQTRVWNATDGMEIQVFVVCFEARLAEGEPRPLDKKVSEVGWFLKEDLGEIDLLVGIKEFIELAGKA